VQYEREQLGHRPDERDAVSAPRTRGGGQEGQDASLIGAKVDGAEQPAGIS
jgi:hypothetical protein